jgi:lipoyl(octanoyl) transferase
VIKCFHLGLIDYPSACDLQNQLQKLRIEGGIEDVLLLLEHPPTLTFKRTKDLDNLIFPKQELIRKGISLQPTDRGGSITCHGPGQLVCYPILDLNRRNRDIHQYVFDLQEVIIRTLKNFSIQAGRDPKHVGVWVGQDKIAAIGLNVKRGVTKHGFALNVNNTLDHFSFIHPCGILDRGVTSMSKLLNKKLSQEDVVKTVVTHFSDVFGVPVERGDDIVHHVLPGSKNVNGFY